MGEKIRGTNPVEVVNMPQSAETWDPERDVLDNKAETYYPNFELPSNRALLMRWRTVQSYIFQAGRSTLRATEHLRSQAWRNFEKTRNEKPMHLLAAVAGTAFVAGALLRIWRSNER